MACARCLTHHRSLVYVSEGMKQACYVAQRRSLDAALSQMQCGVTLEVNEREISFSGKNVFENHLPVVTNADRLDPEFIESAESGA